MQTNTEIILSEQKNLCLISMVSSNHTCKNPNTQSTIDQCISINPEHYKVPSFLNSKMSLQKYKELEKAVIESRDDPEIEFIIRQNAILRGIRGNNLELRPHERALNEAAISICLKIPRLLFYRKDLWNFANLVT